MTEPAEIAPFEREPQTKSRRSARHSGEFGELVYGHLKSTPASHAWALTALASELLIHHAQSWSKVEHWEPVQEGNLLALSRAEHLRSGELVRERLQETLGTIFGYSQGLNEIGRQLAELKELLQSLGKKVDQLSVGVQSVCIAVRSLVPEPFDIAPPLDIVITAEDDGFQAAFLDANLHAYGETREEALANIRATILEAHSRLNELPDEQLSKSMLRQKQVLNYHLHEAKTR